MRRAVWIGGAVAAVAILAAWWLRGDRNETTAWRFATIERGDLEAVVSATGNLEAVTTIQVGTQVSGIIADIYADFNERVLAGQTIARIDTTLLAIAVRDAEAGLERSQAELDHAERELARIRALRGRDLASETELELSRYTRDVAAAGRKSSSIALERAKRNLDYATIRAPIDGTVIERNVEVGQTVAASLSAPQLFLLANDLSRMRILASVDESDIGSIRDGQTARFTVQAWPDETFEGTVSQVRLQSQVLENVVNYTVVVEVPNESGRLLPGMTATVDFVVDSARDVLMVANSALRFRPSPDQIRPRETDGSGARRESTGAGGGGARASRAASGGDGTEGNGGSRGAGGANRSVLWAPADGGMLAPLPVRTGITDGRSTAIEGPGLEVGQEVVVGTTQGSGAAAAASPFSGNGAQGGPPRPGGF